MSGVAAQLGVVVRVGDGRGGAVALVGAGVAAWTDAGGWLVDGRLGDDSGGLELGDGRSIGAGVATADETGDADALWVGSAIGPAEQPTRATQSPATTNVPIRDAIGVRRPCEPR